ncbi:MAG: hypothetical protein FJX54_18840 [Alphaproteobacteria bacterium]|nr:hypothetical protein [Alphaproteobacteria bacterium]
MRRAAALLVLLLALCFSAGAWAQGKPVPRTIIAFYDGDLYPDIRYTPVHRVFEMPLNHLGLAVTFHDTRRPLPQNLEGVRGAIAWFSGDVMPNPLDFIAWCHRLLDAGGKLSINGGLGMANDKRGKPTPVETINELLQRIGVMYDERHVEFTQDVRVVRKDRALMEFETTLPRQLPAYDRIIKVDPKTDAHLIVREGNDSATDAALVSTHPNGGMIAGEFVHRGDFATPIKQLYVNPFEYLRRVFATDELPKLDTTTLVGRRIYYSHIDGDGWRSQTQVKEYAQRRATAAEVILREAIIAYPNLPVTVAPIVADLDPAWFGSEAAQELAREAFRLPQVEMGTHTWSHPFDWSFFADGDASKEVSLLRKYPRRPGGNDEQAWAPVIRTAANKPATEFKGKVEGSSGGYTIPRGYAVKPFDIGLEIKGSIDFLNALGPPGKRVTLLQWSGNCLPWEQAIIDTYAAGVLNMNGGDTRFDREFPSYTSVAPLARKLPRTIQVFSSNANENVYTDLWTDRFFGFAFLIQTWRNTEVPIRVKPKNVYYHMYSGEKMASLRALLTTLKEAEAEPIAPVAASEYAAMVLGFFSAEIADLGSDRWQITKRGKLQTIRFDRAIDRKVDFARSSGVVGQMHFQGSLYIALDPADPLPVVALTANDRTDVAPSAARSYLIDSRWPVEGLALDGRSFAFRARGFGPGDMSWKVEGAGRYQITASDGERTLESFAEVGSDGILSFTLRTQPTMSASVTVRHIPGS